MKDIKGPSKLTIERVANEVDRMVKAGDWNPASPYHLVSLFGRCYKEVYGIPEFETENPKTFGLAAILAKNLLAKRFSGNIKLMVEFIRWTWKREVAREEWRKQNATEGREFKRIGFRLQFSDSLFSDYVLHLRRQGVPFRTDTQQESGQPPTQSVLNPRSSNLENYSTLF